MGRKSGQKPRGAHKSHRFPEAGHTPGSQVRPHLQPDDRMLLNSGPMGLLQVRWVPYTLETIYCPCLFFLNVVLCEASLFSTHASVSHFLAPTSFCPSSILSASHLLFFLSFRSRSLLSPSPSYRKARPTYEAIQHSRLGGVL